MKQSEKTTRVILTEVSPAENLEELVDSGDRRKVLKEAFHFQWTEEFSMRLGRKCEDYILVYTGKDFTTLNGGRNDDDDLQSLERHPMFEDSKQLSTITLKTFHCSGDFTAVTTKGNVIYVALLYLNETPAYYVGKASKGIKGRWCGAQAGSHCKEINNIMRCCENAPGAFNLVVHQAESDLAVAGAVMKQVATNGGGVALFAMDFSPMGKIKCSNTEHRAAAKCKSRQAIDHYEQHYLNVFGDRFKKVWCLNAKESNNCHDCGSQGHECSTEVALSLCLYNV